MGAIKFDQDFKDLEGNVLNAEKECCIQKTNGELAMSGGKLVTTMVPTPDKKLELKQVCIQALLTDKPDDTPEFKAEKFILFQKFHNANGKIELTSEETTLVKNQIAKAYSTFIMGQAHAMLEGK